MKAISEIVAMMGTEEQQRFLNYQKQKNKRSHTHNTKLFKLLASGNSKKSAVLKIYGEENTNAYNALNKRLLDNLLEFIAIEGFKNDASSEMELMKMLLTGRILLKQQLYKTGFKLLKKVIQKSEALELFGLAAEAYHNYIEYLHKDTANYKNELIEKAQVNLSKFQETEKLHLNFALFRKSLSENPNNEQLESLSMLLNRFFGDATQLQQSFTYKTLFQLMDTCNEYASLYQEFYAITPFMKKIYDTISQKEHLSDHHLFYHIQVVYMMANLYFRNKDFTTSLYYLEKMNHLMQQQNSSYQKRFALKYGLLKSLNFHYNGQIKKAITIAESKLSQIKNPEIADHSNLLLALAMYYFHLKNTNKVSSILRYWHRTDAWYIKHLGVEWTAKKNMFEIIFHVEKENREYALSRIKSFKKRFKPYLNKLTNASVFLRLIEKHIQNPENTQTEAFALYAEKSIVWKEQDQEDIFVMNSYAWLKSKMTATDLSEVLKNLIASSTKKH